MPTWAALEAELDNWRREGTIGTFWWRDDDAISATIELDRLLQCAGSVPIGLAVIPGLADRSLARHLSEHPSVSVLQHGWKHLNHACEGSNSEYPPMRDEKSVTREFIDGRNALIDLFGPQSLPVFVPPWHGLDERYIPLMATAGLSGLSRKGVRNATILHGQNLSNIHCVPIQWTSPPRFNSDGDCLRMLVEHLEGRRTGHFDSLEPTGLLTHHLVQDEASYDFMREMVDLVKGHPAARWLDPRTVFAAGQKDSSSFEHC